MNGRMKRTGGVDFFPIFFGAVAMCVVGLIVLAIYGMIRSPGASTECINGYTFVRNLYDGGLVQMMDEVGRGVKCQ